MGYPANHKASMKDLQGCALKGCAAVMLGGILIVVLGVAALKFYDRIPKTVAEENNGEYSVELQATSSPFMFGPQDGRIVLKKGGKKVQTEDFWIANDGKYMSDSNWNVAWETDRVTVTISGEEQPDDVHLLCYQSE